MQDIREAHTTFVTQVTGQVLTVRKGDLVRTDHPVYEGNEQFFREPRSRYVRFETAVDGPNELRNLDLSHFEEVQVQAVSEDLPLKDLQAAARKLGLPDYGAKPALVDRINKHLGV